MNDLGKYLVIGGLLIAFIGAVVLGLSRLGFRGLPGDISVRSPNVQFYFPIVSCIAISVLLSLGAWLLRWISGR